MMYDVEFVFPPEMTVGQVNALIDRIGSELDGSVSTAEYWIDENGFSIYANFDYANIRPKAIRRWASDNGVTVMTGLDEENGIGE